MKGGVKCEDAKRQNAERIRIRIRTRACFGWHGYVRYGLRFRVITTQTRRLCVHNMLRSLLFVSVGVIPGQVIA